MIIIMKKITVVIIILSLLALFGLLYFLFNTTSEAAFTEFIELDEDLQNLLNSEIKLNFSIRNKAILENNNSYIDELYNKETRNGLWAYEHELKKIEYLNKWANKQGIKFTDINSHIVIRSVNEKGEGYSINILVSTEFNYKYENFSGFNSFRLGTYHSMGIIPKDDSWVIVREWYTDPFADSLDLDDIKSQELKELILSSTPRDLSDLDNKRIKAVEYADMYAGAASLPEYGFKYNSKYRNYNYSGGDCANFTSQILFEGGGFPKNRIWNYERGAGSKSWINANAFNKYMLNSGRATLISRGSYEEVLKSSYNLLPGDYIAYEKKGKVTHISVVTGADSKGYILVNSHNSDRFRVPWDLGWSNKGIKFSLVRVNY